MQTPFWFSTVGRDFGVIQLCSEIMKKKKKGWRIVFIRNTKKQEFKCSSHKVKRENEKV